MGLISHGQIIWWHRSWVDFSSQYSTFFMFLHFLNFHGCSKGNPVAAGAGELIRNSMGTWIKGLIINPGACSSELKLWTACYWIWIGLVARTSQANLGIGFFTHNCSTIRKVSYQGRRELCLDFQSKINSRERVRSPDTKHIQRPFGNRWREISFIMRLPNKYIINAWHCAIQIVTARGTPWLERQIFGSFTRWEQLSIQQRHLPEGVREALGEGFGP